MMQFSSGLLRKAKLLKQNTEEHNKLLSDNFIIKLKKTMNYNIYRISRDKWNKIVNNHSRQRHNPTSGNQIYIGKKGKESF